MAATLEKKKLARVSEGWFYSLFFVASLLFSGHRGSLPPSLSHSASYLEKKALPYPLDTQGLVKVHQWQGDKAQHMQRYAGNLKGY